MTPTSKYGGEDADRTQTVLDFTDLAFLNIVVTGLLVALIVLLWLEYKDALDREEGR